MSFHTTMVLTQHKFAAMHTAWSQVSIPLWFLRNLRSEKYPFMVAHLFPYHYGSYKSSPPLTVQEHGPVLREEQFFVPTLRVQVLRSWPKIP